MCYSLQNAGVAFDFAGSLQSGAGFSDIDHEGHPGILADQLDAPTYLANNPAGAVFLEVGANDISYGESATAAYNDIERPADDIHHANAAGAYFALFFFLRSVFNKILQENQALRHNIFPQSSWRAAINVTLIKLINAKG